MMKTLQVNIPAEITCHWNKDQGVWEYHSSKQSLPQSESLLRSFKHQLLADAVYKKYGSEWKVVLVGRHSSTLIIYRERQQQNMSLKYSYVDDGEIVLDEFVESF